MSAQDPDGGVPHSLSNTCMQQSHCQPLSLHSHLHASNDEFTKLFATALFLVVRLETPASVHHKGTDGKPSSSEKDWKDL